MSEEQYGVVITNLIVNQSMLCAILKVLGVKEKEVNELSDLGVKVAKQILKNIKETEKKNGK